MRHECAVGLLVFKYVHLWSPAQRFPRSSYKLLGMLWQSAKGFLLHLPALFVEHSQPSFSAI